MKDTRVSIIGLGQVGMAFLKALSERNIEIISVFNRSEIDPAIIKEFPNPVFKKGLPAQNDPLGELIFLTVSDDAIAKVAEHLSEALPEPENKNVIHCSGTHSSGVLAPLSKIGVKTASFHPIKAITKKTKSFKDIWFDMEGDEELLNTLEHLAEKLGASSFRVEPDAKPYLHASAVVASNYLVVLADLVSKISAQGNIPEETAIKALVPLMENTLSNITELGVKDALTGPIARGDVQTIEKHLQSLKAAPELKLMYKVLGKQATEIAERKNGATDSLSKIKALLS